MIDQTKVIEIAKEAGIDFDPNFPEKGFIYFVNEVNLVTFATLLQQEMMKGSEPVGYVPETVNIELAEYRESKVYAEQSDGLLPVFTHPSPQVKE